MAEHGRRPKFFHINMPLHLVAPPQRAYLSQNFMPKDEVFDFLWFIPFPIMSPRTQRKKKENMHISDFSSFINKSIKGDTHKENGAKKYQYKLPLPRCRSAEVVVNSCGLWSWERCICTWWVDLGRIDFGREFYGVLDYLCVSIKNVVNGCQEVRCKQDWCSLMVHFFCWDTDFEVRDSLVILFVDDSYVHLLGMQ